MSDAAPSSKRIADWLELRTGYRRALRYALDEPVLGGASFAYVFGSVLTFLLVLQMVTGVFLALYYSPSARDAWASVAYIQDTVSLGWFVRGLHSHGASAMVIVAGLHLLQTALYGAYKKPRELNWIIGVLMLGLILAFALTGYLLPWDQTGYWATKVATGIAGTAPIAGEALQQLGQGGNEYGNLTLTRFFALHVFVLPGALIGLTVLHIALFRRHKQTPHWWLSDKELERRAQPFWPDQLFKDLVAMAVAFAALCVVNLVTGGAHLGAPADPASNFDARPEWYFRPLFQALKYFEGHMEQVVALGAPVVVGGVLLALPFLDRGPDRSPLRRAPFLAIIAGGVVMTGLLTVISFREDAADPAVQASLSGSKERAAEARRLARENGVPPAGGLAVFTTAPHYQARAMFEADCAGCHVGDERSAPEIGPGYNSRAWIRDFLRDPAGDRFFGRTSIDGMKPVEATGAELDALVELVYAETGAPDADAALAARGRQLFEDGTCSACHAIDGTTEDEIGPNLGRRGSVDMLTDFIGRPDHPLWFGEAGAEMPGFIETYNRAERQLLAEYLASLRDATPAPAAE